MNKRQMQTAIFHLNNAVARINNTTVVLMRCFQKLVDKNLLTREEFTSAFDESRTEVQPIFDPSSIAGSAIQPEETGTNEDSVGDLDTGILRSESDGADDGSSGASESR